MTTRTTKLKSKWRVVNASTGRPVLRKNGLPVDGGGFANLTDAEAQRRELGAQERQDAHVPGHRPRLRTNQLGDLRRVLPRRRRIASLSRQLPPRLIEIQYSRELLRIVEEIASIIREELAVPLQELDSARFDADEGSRVLRAIARAKARAKALVAKSRISRLARGIAERVGIAQRRELGQQMVEAIGVDIVPDASEKVITDFVNENLALIEDIPDQTLSQISQEVSRGIRQGKRAEGITEDIQDRLNVSRSRAKLIARDQVHTVFGELQKKRQETLGIKKYIWRTANDERVRPEHAARESVEFAWNNPPPDGHPGQPINCRCTAEPVFDELLEGL